MENDSSYLLGQETELAISFQGDENDHPGNKVIFDYMAKAIKSIVKTKPGKRNFIQDQFFVQNGGAIYYEHHPQSLRKGLIECATPECHSAHELILYQRAQEALLQKALPLAKKMMAYDGFEGELRLIKNCRDYEGNTYGSQENYDSQVAEGWKHVFFVMTLLLYVPVAIAFKILYMLVLVPFVFSVFCVKVVMELLFVMVSSPLLESTLMRLKVLSNLKVAVRNSVLRLDFENDDAEESLLKLEYLMFYPLFWLSYKPLISIYNAFAFRPQRNTIHSHIISRIIYTGAGSLVEEGRYILSEKSLTINCFLRRSIHRNDKPLFDCGNLIKEYELSIWELFIFRFRSWGQIFKKDQRLQVAFSDSNRCHFAEFLKIGTTSLVVRMANDGFLNDAPELADPIEALNTFTKDLDLTAKVETKDHQALSAIELQRWYLNRSKEYLKQKTASIEDHDVIRLWGETLDLLETNISALLGRVDWITKRQLLNTSGADLEFWERKKIDLKYHELGEGYFETLQENGMTLDLFSSPDVEKAIFEASSSKRAKMRSHLIKSVALEGLPMTISWGQAKIGRWNPKVISLANYKKLKEEDVS